MKGATVALQSLPMGLRSLIEARSTTAEHSDEVLFSCEGEDNPPILDLGMGMRITRSVDIVQVEERLLAYSEKPREGRFSW
jgi:hypothetical protein